MGQIEVYEWLKTMREAGDEGYFSASEIMKAFKDKGLTNGTISRVRANLLALHRAGYLEIKMSGDLTDWRRLYRIKLKYLKTT